MPKTLSLKKCPVNVLKNQKAITQYFKAKDGLKAPEIKGKDSTLPSSSGSQTLYISDDTNKVAKKRKVGSILDSEIVELNDSSHTIISDSKKLKYDEFHSKENNETLPSIENKIFCKKYEAKDSSNSSKNNANISHSRSSRSPLSSVELSISSENNINQTQCCINGGDNNHIQKSETSIVKLGSENIEKDNWNDKETCITTDLKKEIECSPRITKWTPEKISKNKCSPSKKGSTVKVLDFEEDVGNMFDNDEWDIDETDKGEENLDLSIIQRFEIISIKNCPNGLEIRLKNASQQSGTCYVEGVWMATPLSHGDMISVLACRDSLGRYVVNNTSGLIVLRPDHLMSTTSVVAGVFCRRKAVLQERWRGIDSASSAMTIGILIHELVQKALTNSISDLEKLRTEVDVIIKDSIQMLYDAGMTETDARTNMQTYLRPLCDFMLTYVQGKPTADSRNKKWNGHIEKVLDIEENVCCPQLGLKGKIDATLQLNIQKKKGIETIIAPLELKSGKASMSAEHRGQLIMYGMMMSIQKNGDPTTELQRGLLLYLRDRVDLHEVSCGYPERRDLVMLRNQLAQYLATGPGVPDLENLTDIEDASRLLQQNLPEPIRHETACNKCPYLTLCSVHLWHTEDHKVSESHPLSRLREVAVGHLSDEHIKYFLHWCTLLRLEEKEQMSTAPLHSLWTQSAVKRAERGACAANLKLKSVETLGDSYLHRFERAADCAGIKENGSQRKGPQESEFSIVSIDNRPWIAAGVVSVATHREICITLERDLSRRFSKETLFHIDTYESYATIIQNLTNLGVLIEDSDRALRLRKLIIDKEIPVFEKKLPRDVGRLCAKLMRSLNIEQQRAVLKVLATKDYALLQGLPGTGKTQTISVLIQMLVGLKQRVLVTAHTHSAVDTVLKRLPDSMRVMRLGSSSRVANSVLARGERSLAAGCETPEQLERLYNSMEVVGVTCLGAAHAMLARTTFDMCIVDEATQVLQCTVLRPLFAAKRFVLVGDPEQLPPVVKSRTARRLGMEESLFHRLLNEAATFTLQMQYRMNKQLVDLANRVAYDNKLKCANEKVAEAKLNVSMKNISQLAPWLQRACSPLPEDVAVFIDMKRVETNPNGVEDAENGRGLANADEARVVFSLVETFKMVGIDVSDIGVIAPYRDQVSLLCQTLVSLNVEVSTVDQFQGRDKSVIIYSCTKRNRGLCDRKIKKGEVLNDQRRLAVSVTRAKHKLIVIGDSQALQQYVPLQRLIEACATIVLETTDVEKFKINPL